MVNRLFFALACFGMVSPAALAQPNESPLLQMMEMRELVPTDTGASAKARAAVFSALGALPADTDSFFTLTRLGDLAQFFAGTDFGMFGGDLLGELDGLALGMSQSAVKDLQRMMPLFEALTDTNDEIAESWMEKANDAAGRAIAAQQRDNSQSRGEKLVAATQDFHLAPIYLTLTCRPGGERLLQQLSVLPLMLPMDSNGMAEMMVRSGWRGFCLHGNRVDFSAAELAPEQEDQLQKNLQNARIYLAARAEKNRLVLVLCSNLDEARLPSSPQRSLLATDKMKPFDSYLPRQVWAAGYSSPDVVNMRESMNLQAYRGAAAFVRGVIARMGAQNEAGANAVASIDALLGMLAELVKPRQVPEQMVVWRDGPIYMNFVCDAAGQSFEPGQWANLSSARADDTVLYVASTPVKGTPKLNVTEILNHVENVQKGYAGTLSAELAAEDIADMRELQQLRPGLELAVAGLQQLGASLSGNLSLLVSDLGAAATDEQPLLVTMQAGVADAAALTESGNTLQAAVRALGASADFQDCKLNVQTTETALLFSNAAAGSASLAPGPLTPVEGGAAFSLNLNAAARVLEQHARRNAHDREAAANAMQMREAASYVERVEGCMRSSGNQLHTTLRLYPTF